MTFSQKLIKLRANKGISQFNLANEINVSKTTIENWELGTATPDLDELNKLCNYFGVTADWFAGRQNYRNYGFYPMPAQINYKSKKTLFGLPLVHISFGKGMPTAKGIIAIGTRAVGLISIGTFSLGIISLGAISAGLLSLGALSLGLLLSLGGLSVGAVSLGGISVGIFAIGGFAAGVYSIGGIAVASKIAGGGITYAPLSIGKKPTGETILDLNLLPTPNDIKTAILNKFPDTHKTIVDFFMMIKND